MTTWYIFLLLAWSELDNIPCKIMSLILTMFGYTTLLEIYLHIRNSLCPPLFTIINNIKEDLNMLHGFELLILSCRTGTGNWDTSRKLKAL